MVDFHESGGGVAHVETRFGHAGAELSGMRGGVDVGNGLATLRREVRPAARPGLAVRRRKTL